MAAGEIPLWRGAEQGRDFVQALPGLLPAAAFSLLILEWLSPLLSGDARLFAWPFALAFGNAWLLGSIAKAQGLSLKDGFSFGWQRVGDFLTCAALYWLFTAVFLFAAVGLLRVAMGRPLYGPEQDPQSDSAFMLALVVLGYLLLRVTTSCLGPLLDERHGQWPRGLSAPVHGWQLTRGLQAHVRHLLPLAIGLLVVAGLQYLRDTQADPQGWGWLLMLIWHGLAWPAFSWLCIERCAALAQAREAAVRAAPPTKPAKGPFTRRSGPPPRPSPVTTHASEPAMSERPNTHHYSEDWSRDEVFLSAAVNGDVAKLREMVSAGMPVDTRDQYGVTALLRAANAEKPVAVRYLLEAGASPLARDQSGRSVVHLLVAYPATLPLLDLVLGLGLTLDDQCEGGDTPLMTALLRGHLAGARALLDRGADPCIRDRHGNTSVMKMLSGIYAFRNGEEQDDAVQLLEELLQRGVDAKATGEYGRTALSIAASKGLRRAVALLRRYGADGEATSSDGLTPLQQAWSGSHEPLLSELLAQGARVDFHTAVATGRTAEVKAWLEQDPELVNRELLALRSAPLAIAIHRGDARMVQLLLEHGADANGRDPVCGALANAVRHLPQPDVLRLLIDYGARLDAGDGDGNTALNFAARDDRLDLARVLLDAGANPNAATERGYTVLQFARSNAMRELLRQHGGH